MSISNAQIELATDFLISTAGPDATDLADEEFRNAFRTGNFELAEYWRAVRESSARRLAEEQSDFAEPVSEIILASRDSNVVHVNFSAARCA